VHGVATANSILLISFARERLAAGADALTAALDAGSTRFRPVLMTALAMIIGMAPMAIEPGQNAPLGRAVIGGLLFAPARRYSWCRHCSASCMPRPSKGQAVATGCCRADANLIQLERTMSSEEIRDRAAVSS